MQHIEEIYNTICSNNYNEGGDIYEHIPTLYKYATECSTIFETGVRGCVSSWAFAKGLLNNGSDRKKLFLNDISQCEISELLNDCQKCKIDVQYKWINNLELELTDTFDLVFIDTWHVYAQLKRELDKFSKITNKYIIMHDTTVDEIYGETIRLGWDAHRQSLETGFPIEEINCGLWKAVEEFLEKNSEEWVLHERYTNNNGLTILKRIK
jgi:hypothetical protein